MKYWNTHRLYATLQSEKHIIVVEFLPKERLFAFSFLFLKYLHVRIYGARIPTVVAQFMRRAPRDRRRAPVVPSARRGARALRRRKRGAQQELETHTQAERSKDVKVQTFCHRKQYECASFTTGQNTIQGQWGLFPWVQPLILSSFKRI